VRSFRSRDQLNHFLRTAKPVCNHARITAQSFHGELSRNAPFRIRGIFRHESNFIESDSRAAAEICLEALSKRRALDRGLHKRANEGKKIFARHLGTERDARYVCVRKQVGKFAFGGSRLKRHSIEQQLRSGGAEQKPSFARR
jgi:hypothetical protein